MCMVCFTPGHQLSPHLSQTFDQIRQTPSPQSSEKLKLFLLRIVELCVSCQIFELGLNASPQSLEIIWLPWASPARKLVSSLLSRLRGSCAPFRNRWLRWTRQESSCLSDPRKCLPSSVQVKKTKWQFLSWLQLDRFEDLFACKQFLSRRDSCSTSAASTTLQTFCVLRDT